MMRIGYACINTALAGQNVQINRSMVRKTFLAKGLRYASELAWRNVTDLGKIVEWNIAHGLLLYRMSSDMFPWMSEYEFADLPDYVQIAASLKRAGKKAMAHGLRLTYHPGPFNVLSTNNPRVLENTVNELRRHGEIMDMMGLPRSPFAKINIHIGGAFGDRASALQRFIRNVSLLPAAVRERLTVENDDKANMFSVGDLITVHEATGIPIVFDYHHHTMRSGDLLPEEAMLLCYETWPTHTTPVVHFSSSRRRFEDPAAPGSAHADFIHEPIDRFGKDVDIMLEAKAKEQAALLFLKRELYRSS